MVRRRANQSLTDRIFEVIKESIVTCELAPGEPFNELEWARKFKTSRTPVREACNRLIKERLLVSIPNKGYLVPPITIQDVLNIYQLRFIVETPCAEVAAKRATDEDVRGLEALLNLERSKAKQSEIQDLIDMNREFHLRLARKTNNPRLVDLVHSLLIESARHDHFSMHLTTENWTDHSEILAAVKKRDPSRAREAMRAHLQASRERMSHVFMDQTFC